MKLLVEGIETDLLIIMLKNMHGRLAEIIGYGESIDSVHLSDQKAQIITELYKRNVIGEDEYKRFLLSENNLYMPESLKKST